MTILFNVTTLLNEDMGSTREYDIDDPVVVGNDEPQSRQISGQASLLRTRDGVFVTAKLDGMQPERCSRCLAEFDIPLHIEIEQEFLESDHELRNDDGDLFRIDPRELLDLSEAVRQQWSAVMPMQPLCRQECNGLCPLCGQDLNVSACSCRQDVDGRWSALQQLTVKNEGG